MDSIGYWYWWTVLATLMWQWLTNPPQEVKTMADTQVPAGAPEVMIVQAPGKKKPKKKRY